MAPSKVLDFPMGTLIMPTAPGSLSLGSATGSSYPSTPLP
ncbi:rCG43043 [Rattus norvegicus]|uniref:RCG43043 n=1 Tax=Rattus norvegicus TaxID=10116 RepID=A6IWC1_RAT|nr:rCG43043 [Rattus norvegicus]